MLDLNTIIIFSEFPERLVEFYKNVLGEDPVWTGGDYTGFAVGSCILMFGPHNKVKGDNSSPERIMINFETEDVEGEFKRIIELGAKEVAKPYHPGEDPKMMLATLADPDGNYFQLASPIEADTSVN